jgi:CcmD family protein
MDANYIAMTAVLITWAGVVLYLWRLDRKISRREPSS